MIIPSFNSLIYLKKSLRALLHQTFSSWEGIIVDNGSEDGTGKWIEENYPEFRLLSFPYNAGFAKAVNRGAELSRGKYLVVMNADVVLERDFLKKFYRKINQRKEIGIWQPLVLYPDGDTIYSTGILLSSARRVYNRGEGRRISEEESVKEEEIWGVAGCCAVVKREVFTELEGFDEDFFFLLEDFDFSWRARKKGWRFMYFPDAVVYHIGRVTLSRKFRQYLSFRNRYLLLVKNENLKDFLLNLPSILIYEAFRVPYFFLVNPYRGKAMRELLLLLPRKLKERWKE